MHGREWIEASELKVVDEREWMKGSGWKVGDGREWMEGSARKLVYFLAGAHLVQNLPLPRTFSRMGVTHCFPYSLPTPHPHTTHTHTIHIRTHTHTGVTPSV